MSKIDDLLFEPIISVLPWRDQCRIVADYITKKAVTLRPMRRTLELYRPRPYGSLLLENLMEMYHDLGSRQFYYVIIAANGKTILPLVFDGKIIFGKYEDGKVPVLSGFDGRRSIRDLNLVPNTYTKHYVFASEDDARQYIKSLP